MPSVVSIAVSEIIETIHPRALEYGGGSSGLRDLGALEAAVESMHATGWGHDLYPSLPEKAGILAYALVSNHPFVDGNKRTAILAMVVFLGRNGLIIGASNDELQRAFIAVAANELSKEGLTDRIRDWVTPDLDHPYRSFG